MMLPNSRYDPNIAKCGKQNLEILCVCVPLTTWNAEFCPLRTEIKDVCHCLR